MKRLMKSTSGWLLLLGVLAVMLVCPAAAFAKSFLGEFPSSRCTPFSPARNRRSDYFVRLQTSPVGGGVGANMDVDEGQSNLVVTRDKEFWGERPMGNDILAVNGVNVVNAANSPFNNRTTAIYLFDSGADGVSQLEEPLSYFHSLPFITGADLYMPAATPPDGRIRLTMIARDGNGLMQVINIPNWPSTTDRVSVLF